VAKRKAPAPAGSLTPAMMKDLLHKGLDEGK